MCISFKKIFCTVASIFIAVALFSQSKQLSGVVRDAETGDAIPFASLVFRNAGMGRLADSLGMFSFTSDSWPSDTLEVSSAGYETGIYVWDPQDDSVFLSVLLRQRAGLDSVRIVSTEKVNRGWLLWRRIVSNKSKNDWSGFDNYSYGQYSKVEVDLRDVQMDRISIFSPLWPLKNLVYKVRDAVESHIDTAGGHTYLPVYFAETVSDFYYRKDPEKSREVIRGRKDNGIKQDDLVELMGEVGQRVQVYADIIQVFKKDFISPFSRVGDRYYTYRITDTQYVKGRRFLHLVFQPRRQGANTFTGDCLVHDTSYALQRVRLRMAKDANINFVETLSLEQHYEQINDSVWSLAGDHMVVEFSPAGKSRPGFIGKKTARYHARFFNDGRVGRELDRPAPVMLQPPGLEGHPEINRDSMRAEALSDKESALIRMMDSVQQAPAFRQLKTGVKFMATGYLPVGNFQVGPWFYWFSGNDFEGFRTRFDLGTNPHFHKKLWLHGYLAYGFTDRKFKGKAEALYVFSRYPRRSVYGSYINDLDFGQQYYSNVSTDNVFALAIRKDHVPVKFMKAGETRLELFREAVSGFSSTLLLSHKSFLPLRNLPVKESFSALGKNALTTLEAGVRLRYAYQERFREHDYFRTSLGSRYPVAELTLTRGISGFLNSNYDYTKLLGSMAHLARIPPFGTLDYKVFGGLTSGTLPYVFLDIHPGNELYYYNRNAFNMMNKYEFISDRYAGCFVEHNIGSGIFRLIPKLKFRQFWNARVLWGGLSAANRQLNFGQGHPFQSLDGRTYAELGTGIDNILSLVRLDLVWRVSPSSFSPMDHNFGVFGSFRLSF